MGVATSNLIDNDRNVNNNAINNSSFRYTIDDARRSWTKLLFPYLMKNFIHIVKEIPWESYRYNGSSYAQETYIDEDGNDAYHPVHTIDVRAEGMPYYVFGGAVCEILNKKYKAESGVDLRNYVDPTGDFDVQFFYDDTIIYDNPDDAISIVAYNEAGEISPFFEHMTHWLFDRVCEKVESLDIPSHYKSTNSSTMTIPVNNSNIGIYKDYLNVSRDDPLFLYRRFGDLNIIRKKERDMIKIQIAMNLQMLDGSIILDHLVEFIMTTNIDIGNVGMIGRGEKEHMTPINGIQVQGIIEHFASQMKGYFDRIHLFDRNDDSLYHKIKNHIGRMEYLMKMAPFLNKQPVYKLHNIMDGLKHYISLSLPYQLQEKTGRSDVIRVDKSEPIPYSEFTREFMDNYKRKTVGGTRKKSMRKKAQKRKTRAQKRQL
jgi:hypothetical protein